MAIKYVLPGESINWTANASWSDATPPSDGDIVIVGRPEGGGRFVFTTNLDQSAGPLNLAGLIFLDCEVITATPLKMNVNNSGRGVVVAARSGHIRFDGTTNVFSVERALSNPAGGVSIEGGTHALIQAINGGGATVGSGATITDDVVALLGGFLDIKAKSDRIKCRIDEASRIITERNVEDAQVSGRLILRASAAITDASSGGKVELMHRSAYLGLENNAAVTHARVNNWAGVVDHSKALGLQTITNNIETPSSRYIEEGPAGTLVRTNRTKYGFAGSLSNGQFAGVVGI